MRSPPSSRGWIQAIVADCGPMSAMAARVGADAAVDRVLKLRDAPQDDQPALLRARTRTYKPVPLGRPETDWPLQPSSDQLLITAVNPLFVETCPALPLRAAPLVAGALQEKVALVAV